ncbi:MAG: ParB/RepB/Spo0J family partition protein [Sporomusaceae bacterium]|jgi:ParB family chromosome partitioning protein|nr:ParB/RepB/Spo0J family partition protein [Sporomusaceae bacterium]
MSDTVFKLKDFGGLFTPTDPAGKSKQKGCVQHTHDALLGRDLASEKVVEIPLSELHPFKNHPFRVLDDETMQETVESIRKYGVLVPAIARPSAAGGYELIAGHRRKRGSELAEKETMPVLVRNLDDNEATLVMVDSNIQREDLLFSEKAWAYKMKLTALRHQGVKDTSRQIGAKSNSVDVLSENTNESARNIHRFIRLTELLPKLLKMVDEKKLAFNPAVELSYLLKNEQEILLNTMTKLQIIPSLTQAKRLKKYSQEEKLDLNVIDAILTEESLASLQVTLKSDRLRKYFPHDYSKEQMEEIIFSLLEKWNQGQ